MKRKRSPPDTANHGSENAPRQVSRRRVLKGIGAVAGLAVAPKALSVVGDYLLISGEESAEARRKLDERTNATYEKEAKDRIAKVIEANQAKLVKEVQTDSGMQIDVFQTQTGWNPNVPIDVDPKAMNASVNFLVNAMDKINEANGNPIDVQQIANIQDKARAGKLNIHMTVIMSATTAFHAEDGHQVGTSGNSSNFREHAGYDPRKVILPLVCFAPDIYKPGKETITPRPSEGRFTKDDTSDMASFSPDAAQSLSAFFAHETSHVLLDTLGYYYTRGLSSRDLGKHDPGDFAEKTFVLPMSWYHNAALAGQADGQPQLTPPFVVPDLTHVKM